MITGKEKAFIMTVVSIILFSFWMLDRYSLVRKIKEERWRSEEEFAEKEARLEMAKEKMRVEKKEHEKLYLKEEKKIRAEALSEQAGPLPEAPVPGQPGQAAGSTGVKRSEDGRLNQEAKDVREIAAERAIAEMERLYREQGRAREEAEIKAQQKEQAQAQP